MPQDFIWPIILAVRQKGLFPHRWFQDLNGKVLPSQDNANGLFRWCEPYFLGHTVLPEHWLRAPLYSQTCSNLENKVTLYLGTLRLAFLYTLTFSPICLHSVSCSLHPCCSQEMHNKHVLNKKCEVSEKCLSYYNVERLQRFSTKIGGNITSPRYIFVVNDNVYLFLVITDSDLISNNISRTNKIYNDNRILFSLL